MFILLRYLNFTILLLSSFKFLYFFFFYFYLWFLLLLRFNNPSSFIEITVFWSYRHPCSVHCFFQYINFVLHFSKRVRSAKAKHQTCRISFSLLLLFLSYCVSKTFSWFFFSFIKDVPVIFGILLEVEFFCGYENQFSFFYSNTAFRTQPCLNVSI